MRDGHENWWPERNCKTSRCSNFKAKGDPSCPICRGAGEGGDVDDGYSTRECPCVTRKRKISKSEEEKEKEELVILQ